MKKLLIAGAAAAATVAGGTAFAQASRPAPAVPHAHHPGSMMKAATRADLAAHVGTMFARLDTNHDGFITREELSAHDALRSERLEQRAARFDPSRMFDRLDLNHDGQITLAEAQAARSQHAYSRGGEPAKAHASAVGGLFARADTNKDGLVTRAEFDALGQQIKARMEHAAVTDGGMETRMFDTADTNRDGRISLAEIQQAALTRFDRIDLNHDGTISPDERQQARQLSKSQHRPQKFDRPERPARLKRRPSYLANSGAAARRRFAAARDLGEVSSPAILR